MNYKRLIVVLVISAIVFFGFVILSTPDKPPMPEIIYQSKPIKVLQGTYGWETFTKAVQADSPIPPELVGNINPNVVSSKANLKVNFDYKPNDIDVMLWTETGPEDYKINNNSIVMPENNGIYVFEIRGEWEEGDSIYAFKVEVKQ